MSNKVNNRAVYIRASLIILGLFLMSYGNITNHPSINSFTVNDFVAKNKSKLMSKFKNYDFNFSKGKLKGNYISKPGLFNPSEIMNGYTGDRTLVGFNTTYTEVSRSLSPKEWIMHGGFSADEPELPAGMRHFYDPTRPKGSRYLDDIANSKLIGWAQKQLTNPKTDGVDWALGTSGSFGVLDHIYTWENGKKYMKGALETANPEQRKKFMAKAWRSLGETLHMIADNGCPPHVRNDSHPPGNTSPYEEFLAVKSLSPFKKGSVPTSVRTKLRSAKTARDIAHQMAVFTNENFFSNETISGIDWKGIKIKQSAHPDHVYSSPKLQNMDYDDGYYHKNIAGKEVLLCSDKWFFSKFNISRKIPIIDEKCTDSQAKALIPVIKEAGVNVMKLFIPELKIEITSLDPAGTISGIVIHKPDKEYPNTISYSGPVNIKDNNGKILGTIIAENGRFKGKIKNIKTKSFAEIEFGGVSVFSEKASPSQKDLPMERLSFAISKNSKSKEEESLFRSRGSYNAGYEDFSIYSVLDFPCYLTVAGNHFTIKQNYKSKSTLSNGNPKVEKEILAEGELNKEKTQIAYLKIKYYSHKITDPIITKRFVYLKNIPIKFNGRYRFRIMSSDLPQNKALNVIESLSQEYTFYPSETFSMSKKDMINNYSWDLWIDFSPNSSEELFK